MPLMEGVFISWLVASYFLIELGKYCQSQILASVEISNDKDYVLDIFETKWFSMYMNLVTASILVEFSL